MPVAILYPSGAGTFAEWTPSAGTLAAALASNLGAFAFANAAGQRVRLAMDNLPGAAVSVTSVMSFAMVGVDEDGSTARHALRLGASESLGAPFTPLSGGYDAHSLTAALAPDGLAWTVAKVNAVEWGLDAVVLPSGAIYADQGWLAVDYAEAVTSVPPEPVVDVVFPERIDVAQTFPRSCICAFPDPADASLAFPKSAVAPFPPTQPTEIALTPESG